MLTVVVGIDSFLDVGRKSLALSVTIKTDLVFVPVVDINLVSVRRIDLDLITV